jgi:Ca-activated chloride channel family protein
VTFLYPLGLAGLIAIPIIVLLYILKEKREKRVVSSLILWQQVIMDMHARTPWQKLRKNLLMFLQIFAALLIVLALAGLSFQFINTPNKSVILVIDCSLSMSSSDIKPSRIEMAKKDAVEYVGSLPKNSQLTVVTVANEANVLLLSSTSKDDAVKSIQSIKHVNSFTDHMKAEELLLSLKKQNPSAELVLFGDEPIRVGNETVQFSSYKIENNNTALVRFTHTRSNERITAMSVVRNQGDSDREIAVSLYGDGGFLDSQRISLPANQTKTIWWQKIPPTISTLHCVIDTKDYLETDNNAYDIIHSSKPVKVLLVTEGNFFIERALSLIDGVELVRALPDNTADYSGYDLYILDGYVPKRLPEDGNIVIFSPPENEHFLVGGWMDTPEFYPATHSIFEYLESITFSIGRTRIIEKPVWAETILEANQNPIIMDGQIENTRLLIFGFNLYETDLPLKPEFPILMSNIINEYTRGIGTEITDITTYDSIQFRLHPEAVSVKVITPDGGTVSIAPPMPPEPFTKTETPGIYQLQQKTPGDTINGFFAVNLPDEWLMENRRSNTAAAEADTANYIPLQKSGYPLTLPLLAAALLILLLEWWYYANRNYA